jgi:hypothetical protein
MKITRARKIKCLSILKKAGFKVRSVEEDPIGSEVASYVQNKFSSDIHKLFDISFDNEDARAFDDRRESLVKALNEVNFKTNYGELFNRLRVAIAHAQVLMDIARKFKSDKEMTNETARVCNRIWDYADTIMKQIKNREQEYSKEKQTTTQQTPKPQPTQAQPNQAQPTTQPTQAPKTQPTTQPTQTPKPKQNPSYFGEDFAAKRKR